MKIIVTGGAGYIGSHTCLALLRAGHEVCVIDNLQNGKQNALERLTLLANKGVKFFKCDIRDRNFMEEIFTNFIPEVVVHFAGLKSVAESIVDPAKYYDINVGGTAILVDVMNTTGCMNIVFSSSATVYGPPVYLPCNEEHPLHPINPYGRTKMIAENVIQDWSNALSGRRAVALRYFNPIGADQSGLIGEDPLGTPSNLMPLILQVASGRRECLKIFGDNYDTIDGTGVRDYVHVSDVASAHVLTAEKIYEFPSFDTMNIGTGQGVSVLQLINEFEKQTDLKITYEVVSRRPGDAPSVWADVAYAKQKIDFIAKHGLSRMCVDSWKWQKLNPTGYLI